MMKKVLGTLLLITSILGVTMLKFNTKVTTPIVENSPRVSHLSEKLEVGVVELYVKDLDLQKAFYKDLVGLEVQQESDSEVTLGSDTRQIVRLIKDTTLAPFAQDSAGLYHLAILFETRSTLAQALHRILEKEQTLFSGSADHLVSEAFYFSDPEGNGVELYFDRDPKSWVWYDGKVVMGSSYIDPTAYIEQYSSSSASLVKKMGHVHLQVGNIEVARQFYVDVLGFYITAEMPTALFVSDGQYHHTLGMNVWNSNNAKVKKEKTLGLKQFSLKLAHSDDLILLKMRLDKHHVTYDEVEHGLLVIDPWGNNILFHT